MATPKPRVHSPAHVPEPCLDIDLGDTAITVREFADGMWTLDVPVPAEGPLVVTSEIMQTIVSAFDRLGKEKGWV